MKEKIKDKSIKFFNELIEYEGGAPVNIRRYYAFDTIRDEMWSKPLVLEHKAYIRQLSANERFSAMSMQDDSDLEVIVNFRPIKQDMLIEFRDKVYKIGPADNYEFYSREVKFRAKETTARQFKYLEIVNWQEPNKVIVREELSSIVNELKEILDLSQDFEAETFEDDYKQILVDLWKVVNP